MLARILVLDQFTRNARRGTPASFAGDALALAAARAAGRQRRRPALPPVQRWFAYMPFEHAEDARMQERVGGAVHARWPQGDAGFDDVLDYAHRHRGVIARFGRFPHRNVILGRASTPEELAYLAQPGSRFLMAPAATLNLIGAGQVGRVLGRLFAASGAFIVQDVLTRSPASASEAVAFIGAGRAVATRPSMRPADVWHAGRVGDDQIERVCAAGRARLAGRRGPVPLQRRQVVRRAGSRRAAVRHRQRAPGAQLRRSGRRWRPIFGGTLCGVEGDGARWRCCGPPSRPSARAAVAIDAAAKTVYHAASVFASNYLVTVLDAALRAYQAAGIDEATARALAGPLATETLHNVLRWARGRR